MPTALMEMPTLQSAHSDPIVLKFPIYLTPFVQYRTTSGFPKMLNIGNNKLTGMLPPQIGQLQALLTLNLSFNNLHGEIPQSIGNLTNLQVLDLSYNDLTGAIPSSLEMLHFLSKFNISSNDLEGSVPTGGQFSTFPDSSFHLSGGLWYVLRCRSTVRPDGPIQIYLFWLKLLELKCTTTMCLGLRLQICSVRN